jgi:hypothetical protein
MEWLRRMLGHPERDPTSPQLSPEVKAARTRLHRELTRADKAIQAAMGHADDMFAPAAPYRGPDRRTHPR